METTGLTLAGYAQLVDDFLQAWDEKEGVISDEDVAKFVEGLEQRSGALAQKVDNWISFLAYLDHCVLLLKGKRERLTRAIRALEHGIFRKREYIAGCIRAYPGVEYRGDLGKLRLQRPAKAGVQVRFPTKTKSFSNIVAEEALEIDPTIRPFCKHISFWTLDTDKIREEKLLRNDTIPWAKLDDKDVLYVPSLKNDGKTV